MCFPMVINSAIFFLHFSRAKKAVALSEEHKVEKERARLEKDGIELNPNQSRINGFVSSLSF